MTEGVEVAVADVKGDFHFTSYVLMFHEITNYELRMEKDFVKRTLL